MHCPLLYLDFAYPLMPTCIHHLRQLLVLTCFVLLQSLARTTQSLRTRKPYKGSLTKCSLSTSMNLHQETVVRCPNLMCLMISSCSEVWVRVDRVCKSLEAPYSAPYRVVHREQKYFVLRLPQGDTSVSIDRLKPAYLPVVKRPANSVSPVLPCSDLPSRSTPSHDSSQASPRSTRSGRTIRFRRHPDYVYY